MKRIFTLIFMLTLLLSAFSQQSNCPSTVLHQGVTYNTIWVGGNCWMKENLRSTQYGTQSNVFNLQPTYMIYPNTPSTMGYLYTWYTAVGLPEGSTANPPTAISERVQGICPNEWAIPSATQLMSLLNSGEARADIAAYWVYNNGIIPANSNLFNMVPSGYYNDHLDRFVEYNHAGYIWTLNDIENTATCGIFPFDCRISDEMSMSKTNLLSVRCVKAPPYGVEEITACDSLTWNGETHYTTGRYVAHLANDSVSTLLLTVNYTSYYTLPVVACDSYTWDLTGDTYTTSGTDVAVIKNYLNCDSVVTMDLEIRHSNTGIDVQNHCDSYKWIDGITYTESTNTPTFVVTNAAGCDSTVTLNLTIRKMTTGIDVQNHCDSYTWIDGETYTESTNEPTFTLTNAVGCDSVVTLNLTIRKKTYGIDVQDHCDSYAWINGITYTESTNDPVFTITNNAGCDSIVTLNLTIRKQTSSPSQSLTEYNTYTWNDQTYTTSGIYTATLVNAVGCDSTATLDLTILYRFPITYNLDYGVLPSEPVLNYVQGVGATLSIPTKEHYRFEGWYDNASFTGSPISTIGNTESGNKQYWALWTTLEVGLNSCLIFSGSSSAYAQIPTSSALNPTTAITLEAWIYPTTWGTYSYTGSIIAKEIASGSGGYILRCGASGTLSFALGIGSAFQEVTSTGLTLNEWQHVAGVYDGATMKIYRNGVLLNTKAQTGSINTSSNRVEIGRNYAYTSRYFTGKIDEVRIWNTALNQSTIQNWSNKSLTSSHTNYSNLIGYYECDSTASSTILKATAGTAGTMASVTYGASSNCTFKTSSPYSISSPTSVTATHPLAANNLTMYPVVPGDTLAQILRVDVSTVISSRATQIVVSTNGTTTTADLTKARLWYTGTSTTFATTTSFGSPVINPNGTLTFTGNQALSCGTNYFWLTYDIAPTATYNNVVDAELVSCVVERLNITPTNGAPTGNRLIVNPCTSHILQIRDTFGDTWEGGNINVFKNGVALFTGLSITVGSSSNLINNWFNYPFEATSGDTITILRAVPGSTPSEMSVQIVRGSSIALAAITPVASPAVITTVAGCYNIITATAGSNGTISPSGVFNVYGTRSQLFTITPNQYYYIDSVFVNGVNNPSAVSSGTYTFSNLTGPQTIRATFATSYVTPSLITAPTTNLAYEGYLLSSVSLNGGLIQYNGTNIPGTFTWVNPTNSIPSSITFTAAVLFTPNIGTNCLPITFNITGNVTPLSATVANGTTTNEYLPFYGFYMDDPQNSYVLYPDTMLTALVGKTITKLVFYNNSTTAFSFASISTINLGSTTLTELPSTGTPAYTPTTVFVGAITRNADGTVIITLNTPYLYSGGNLILNFVNPDGSSTYSHTYNYGVERTNCGLYNYNTTTTRVSFIPKTKFMYQP
jgi:uncharacterized protein (TIGR02145 family)